MPFGFRIMGGGYLAQGFIEPGPLVKPPAEPEVIKPTLWVETSPLSADRWTEAAGVVIKDDGSI